MWQPMQWVRELRRQIAAPMDDLTRLQRTMRSAIDLVRYCAASLSEHRAAQMAAALTYHTLFSLLPMIIVMLVVLQSFVDQAQLEQFEKTAADWAVEWLGDAETQSTTSEPGSDTAIAGESKQQEFEQTRQQIGTRIRQQIDALGRVDFGSIGLVGVLVLIYGATSLLATVERCFNTIYGVSRSRTWYARLTLYYTIITLGPLVLLTGQWFRNNLSRVINDGPQLFLWFEVPLRILTPLMTIWLVFLFIYLLIPNTVVQRRAAVAGSFVAAMLWVVAIELLTMYVGRASTTTFYGALYGALALVPLFLLWLWLTWLVVLFGLEITYVLQTMRGKQLTEQRARRDLGGLADHLWLLPMMAHIGLAFRTGKTVEREELADKLHLPLNCIQRLEGRLESEGLIHRVPADGHQLGGLALAMPAADIRLGDLIALGRSVTMQDVQSYDGPGSAVLQRLAQAHQAAAADLSLEALLEPGQGAREGVES